MGREETLKRVTTGKLCRVCDGSTAAGGEERVSPSTGDV